MISRQLELGLENRSSMKPVPGGRSRSNRAHWWFEKMRGVVNEARDWPPALPPRRGSRSLPLAIAPDTRSPEALRRTVTAVSRAIDVGRPLAQRRTRWQFGRTHRVLWE